MTRDKVIEQVKNYENYPNGLSKECRDYIIKALEQETVSREAYDHEFFLRKEFELKIDELQSQLEEFVMKAESILEQISTEIDSLEWWCNGEDYLINRKSVKCILDKYKYKSRK